VGLLCTAQLCLVGEPAFGGLYAQLVDDVGVEHHRHVAADPSDPPEIDERGLSDLAIAKLRSSGISLEAAIAAGIYSVENAKEEVHEEFAGVPALIIPYFDVHGEPLFFERDGELFQFVRVRYLADPPARLLITVRVLE
jgi:hypothetical protein